MDNGTMRRNRNRGYQKLRVWIDAIAYYSMTYDVFRSSSYDLKLVQSLELKRDKGDWVDNLLDKENDTEYDIK